MKNINFPLAFLGGIAGALLNFFLGGSISMIVISGLMAFSITLAWCYFIDRVTMKKNS
jgi:multidrug efflux pump subunit AcrB